MTGQQLYAHYLICGSYHKREPLPWSYLDEVERAIWNDTAFEIVMRFGPPEDESGQSL